MKKTRLVLSIGAAVFAALQLSHSASAGEAPATSAASQPGSADAAAAPQAQDAATPRWHKTRRQRENLLRHRRPRRARPRSTSQLNRVFSMKTANGSASYPQTWISGDRRISVGARMSF